MRCDENPLISPQDVAPTRDDFEVASVLNPAVTQYQDQIILVMRVCERPVQQSGVLSVPVLDLDQGGVKVELFREDDPELECDDPRILKYRGRTYLTTLSHLRIARSTDGIHFTADPDPFIFPAGPDEEYGVEDPRITIIDDIYYVYYVAVSRYGISTVLARTRDWHTWERLSIIFPANHKDVAIFPERINGHYHALIRPDTGAYANPCMWTASSPDLLHWGKYQFLMGPRRNTWDGRRIGAGTVPLRTNRGWLEIYHGASDQNVYSLGLLLLDLQDPSNVLFRSENAFFVPTEPYERNGFFSDVVFTNGMITFRDSDMIMLYYGAADQYICGARLQLDDLLKMCSSV
jgi:beta-1,2-mannobiose phosphorylase / 1,2-beta-oligomannan phosphorylase